MQKIQIPNELITNPTISVNATYLYVQLKMRYNYNTQIFSMKTANFLQAINWSKRTLKTYLAELKDKQYIKYEFENLPKQQDMKITILPYPYCENEKYKGYTQITVQVIKKVSELAKKIPIYKSNGVDAKTKKKKIVFTENKDLTEYAIRILLLYKKFDIISKQNNEPKIWLGHREANECMKIRSTYHSGINKTLKQNKLIHYKNQREKYVNTEGKEVYAARHYYIYY